MAIHLITYDLNSPGQKYEKLYEAIKSAGSTWCHPLDSTWLIVTTKSVQQTVDYIRNAALDDTDTVFVVDVTSDTRRGWLSKEVWDWIEKYWP